jgi:hypothetical protein
MNDPSAWEAQAVSDLLAAALPELSGFQVEALTNQVDWEKDQLTTAVAHVLVAWVEANHEGGYQGADAFTLAFVAIVPGGNQYERRMRAINAAQAIANWMRSSVSAYQPLRSVVEKVNPFAVATLTATRVG